MTDITQDARNLQTWLLLPGAEARYPGANVMASWLEIGYSDFDVYWQRINKE